MYVGASGVPAIEEAQPELEAVVARDRRLSGAGDEAAGAAADLAKELRLDDRDGVDALLADDWIHVELPGTLAAVADGQSRQAIEFALGVADVDLGGCRPDPRIVSGIVDARAVCDQVAVHGAYPEAYGLAGGDQTVFIGVVDERIVSLFWSGQPVDALSIGAVCSFAQETMPDEASVAFGSGCLPVESPEAAAAHIAIAEAYLAAGSPRDTQQLIEERHARSLVDRVVAAYRDDADPSRYVGSDDAVSIMPGLLVDRDDPPFPTMAAALVWSALVFDIDVGACRTERLGSLIRVACPEATWQGPLVAALGLGPVAQPVDFYVEGQRIIIIEGDTAPELRSAFADLCGWGASRLPEVSGRAFERGCVPRHDDSGARALLTLAGRYAAAG